MDASTMPSAISRKAITVGLSFSQARAGWTVPLANWRARRVQHQLKAVIHSIETIFYCDTRHKTPRSIRCENDSKARVYLLPRAVWNGAPIRAAGPRGSLAAAPPATDGNGDGHARWPAGRRARARTRR